LVPSASFLVPSVAFPFERIAVPSVFLPSLNVIFPAGAAVPGATENTVAVSVTICPEKPGLADGDTLAAVATWTTLSVIEADVDDVKPELPLYIAVIVELASGSVDVVNTAEPPARGTVASAEVPLMKVTVPSGVPAPEAGLTVATKFTSCPKTRLADDEFSDVWLPTCVIVKLAAGDTLVPKSTPPLYTAVIEGLPSENVVVNTALPPLKAIVPIEFVPSMNVTSPVGVPLPGDFAVTVAVRTTGAPGAEGDPDVTRLVALASCATD
jgi:hypothetical protein